MSIYDFYSLRILRQSVLNARFAFSQIAVIILVMWYLIRGVFQFNFFDGILLYALRPLQYFLVYHFLVNRESLNLKLLWGIITCLYLISKFVFGQLYFPFAYNWEVAFYYGIMIVHWANISKKDYWIFILVSSAIVLISDQKSILLGTIIASFSRRGLLFFTTTLLFYMVFFYQDSRMESFISSFTLTETLDAISRGFDLLEGNLKDYHQFVYEDRSLLSSRGDLSFHLRLRKWIFAYQDMGFGELIFGLGPGYFGGAADSSLFRLFFEVGIIGLIIGVWALLSSGMLTKRIGIFLFVTGFFLDTYYSSTCLSIFTVLWKTSSSPAERALSAHMS